MFAPVVQRGRQAGADARSLDDDYFLCILAHESRSVIVRLNTGLSGVESGSTQKYPNRSNWYTVPGAAPFTLGSI
jgi:hypothetical protein